MHIFLIYDPQRLGQLSVSVRESESQEGVHGATVSIPDLRTGGISNAEGEVNLRGLNLGKHILKIHRMGYRDTTLTVEIKPGQKSTLLISLPPQILKLEEVSIRHDNIIEPVGPASATLSSFHLEAAQSANEDAAQAIRLLPGVASTNSLFFSPGLYVRGGEPEENLTLIDNIRLPYPWFLFGKSILNPELIQQTEVMTGGFSARYGNHMSSVQNHQTRNGNRDHIAGRVKQSLWNTNLRLEGPMIKEKLSVLAVGRRSTFDWIWPRVGGEFPVTTDAALKLNYKAGQKHRLSLLNLFAGDDLRPGNGQQELPSAGESVWANSFQWQYLPGERFYSKFNLLQSQSKLEILEGAEQFNRYQQVEWAFREDIRWSMTKYHFMKAGISATSESVKGRILNKYQATDHAVGDTAKLWLNQDLQSKTQRIEAYAMLEGRLRERFAYLIGGRLDYNFQLKQPIFSPRSSLQYSPLKWAQFNMTYGQYYQEPAGHLLRFFPELNASRCDHYLVSGQVNPGANWMVTTTLYRKEYQSLIVFDTAGIYQNRGTGTTQGIEFNAVWKKARFQGWANYTWSRSDRLRHLQDREHSFYFDQRHQASLGGIFRFRERSGWQPNWCELDLNFQSGRPYTPALGTETRNGMQEIRWGAIHSERLPNSFSLNGKVVWQYKLETSKPQSLGWYLSIWNLTGRQNPITQNTFLDDEVAGGVVSELETGLPFFLDAGISWDF